ncbi:MAG: chemotaxis protein CheW [Rhizonema sp. PD37]|nr:chemotaxis protein CheW [Rhizonema sp. PD37]
MKSQSYLTFSLNKRLYGINTTYIKETFALPELTPILKASNDVVGTVNLRGDILPVMDLSFRFSGYQSADYSLTDSVIVLKWEDFSVGIIVNAIHELRSLSTEEITTESYEQALAEVKLDKSIAGIAYGAENMIILSNPGNWIRYGEIQQVLFVSKYLNDEIQEGLNTNKLSAQNSELLLSQQSVFSTNATLEERAIFRERAAQLMLSTQKQDLRNLKPLTIFTLNSHFFGIDLKMVREFAEIRKVTPVPCVGTQIIGNMNLRGEILTLVDICGLLNLPALNSSHCSKAIVVEVESVVGGVVVEEVCDVMFFLNPLDITAVPTSMYSSNAQYLLGTIPYREKMMSILNLPRILLHGGFIVDEVN